MSLSLSTLDGRLELRERLGQGGMGEVHAAWDAALQRAVAVKFLRSGDPREAERLLLEARLQARVEHPHVVRVFEVGSLGGRPCIVLQLVRGSTLGEAAPGLSVAQRVELVRQAALGLHAAHLQGLVHRDVKPGNVLVEVGEDGERTALVTDFGLAHAEEGGLTRSGLLPGTLDYMAPEQLVPGQPVDFRADVHALGAALYAVVAGQPPFRVSSGRAGDDAAQHLLLRRILEEDPPPLHAVLPGTPRELGQVAARAMEKTPGARYPTAEALAEDLARFQRGEPVLARPPSPAERVLKWARRNPAASRALAASLAVLLLAGAFTLWFQRQAGLAQLEAVRLVTAAMALDSRMRMEHLSPPHDLRPVRAAVKSEVEGLRPQAATPAASFALGKGLELLGDLDGARAAYQEAWDRGFRHPLVAASLGAALARLYQREVTRARDAVSPEAVAELRLPALRDQLQVPAKRFLEQVAGAPGWQGPFVRGQLALLEGDFEAARRGAAETLAVDPQRYEARVLEGQAWLLEGRELFENLRLEEASGRLDRALVPLERAVEAGRSDAALLALVAETHAVAAMADTTLGRSPAAHAQAALAWADRAALVDPDSAAVETTRARALDTAARHAAASGAPALATLEAAVGHYRRAIALQPDWVRPRIHLTHNALARVEACQRAGLPVRPVLEEGLAAYREGLALEPQNDQLVFGALLLHAREAELLEAEGKDPAPALHAAIHHGEALIRPERGNLVQRLRRANANVRIAGVEGDTPALTIIERLLQAADGFGAAGEYLALRAMVPLVAATWAAERGHAPDAALARAERGFERILAQDAASAEAHAGLASCALVKARWLGQRGEDAGPALAAGLAHAAQVLVRTPRDPRAWVLQAQLQAAGRDAPAARRSLDQAYALEPLVRGSYEAKTAEGALERLSTR